MMAYADLAVECERLARDFERLALADVSGAIVTERSLTWCRRPIPRVRDKGRLIARITAKPRHSVITGNAAGCELGDIAPQTAEEELSASVWYGPSYCEPVVNSAGQSMVMDPGWETLHEWELSGTNASHAYELLERAGQWTQERWGWLSRLLWHRRGSVAGKHCWPDIVNQVSELALDATLPRPEWSVIVGKYRAWWPVAMWKTRDEWQLGEPQYTPEDVERIGEDPEVVIAARKHWLRDSETALEWLAKQFSKEQPVAPVVVPADASGLFDGLSPDGLTLRWDGSTYPLSETAARLVKLLVDAFDSKFPYLHEEYLKTEGEFDSDVRNIVRSAGLGSIVCREVGSNGKTIKGKWGLIAPKKVLLPR